MRITSPQQYISVCNTTVSKAADVLKTNPVAKQLGITKFAPFITEAWEQKQGVIKKNERDFFWKSPAKQDQDNGVEIDKINKKIGPQVMIHSQLDDDGNGAIDGEMKLWPRTGSIEVKGTIQRKREGKATWADIVISPQKSKPLQEVQVEYSLNHLLFAAANYSFKHPKHFNLYTLTPPKSLKELPTDEKKEQFFKTLKPETLPVTGKPSEVPNNVSDMINNFICPAVTNGYARFRVLPGFLS